MSPMKFTKVLFVVLAIFVCSDADDSHQPLDETVTDDNSVTNEQIDYAKGSVCGYCEYCKFCKLCEEDCPCETSPKKPNCKMCKYCKYCNLCSAVCNTICTPGGILDRVSGAIVSALPTVNRVQVDSDIESVKTWIDKKKDEL